MDKFYFWKQVVYYTKPCRYSQGAEKKLNSVDTHRCWETIPFFPYLGQIMIPIIQILERYYYYNFVHPVLRCFHQPFSIQQGHRNWGGPGRPPKCFQNSILANFKLIFIIKRSRWFFKFVTWKCLISKQYFLFYISVWLSDTYPHIFNYKANFIWKN